MWKQVRRPAGAVMCQTRDLGIKWPHWHTVIFSNDTEIDMRCVCVRKKLKRCWCRGPGYQSVSSLPDGGRHRKAQALPLPGMARSEARYSRKFSGNGSKRRQRQRKNGNGKEV